MLEPRSATAPALQARARVAAMLEAAGIAGTLDAGAFYPQPVGVLIGLPTRVTTSIGGALTFTVPVHVVSGDALNAPHVVDRLYTLADAVASATRTPPYRPTSWRGGPNAEPLPAIELEVFVIVQ